MDDLSIYSEKKLAGFETNYKESILAKPTEVSVTITAAHIYGQGYICEQVGTQEDDPVYSRFSCSFDEITKIYINNNNKNSPIYIQCDQNNKGVVNRRRIILPSFSNNDEIVNIINSAKAEVDKKLEKQRENEKQRKIHELEERRDKESIFEPKPISEPENIEIRKARKNAEAAKTAQIDELLEFDNIIEPIPVTIPAPAPEVKPAPAPAPEVKPAPAPAPEVKPAPAPAAEVKPATEPAKATYDVKSAEDGMSLEEFETAVKKLKAMLDNGVMTKDEFTAEKSKLLKFLY